MGTITARKRQDGCMAFRAGIHLKQNGRTVHKESKTFDRRPTAKAWMARREKQLREPGGLEAAQGKKGTLDDLIGTYRQKMPKSISRTKAQCLNIHAKPISKSLDSGLPAHVQSAMVAPRSAGRAQAVPAICGRSPLL